MPRVIQMSWGHSRGISFREGFGSEIEEEKGLESLGKMFYSGHLATMNYKGLLPPAVIPLPPSPGAVDFVGGTVLMVHVLFLEWHHHWCVPGEPLQLAHRGGGCDVNHVCQDRPLAGDNCKNQSDPGHDVSTLFQISNCLGS